MLAGLGVIGLLIAAIIAMTAWHMRWFDGIERPRSLERLLSRTPPIRTDQTPPTVASSPAPAPAPSETAVSATAPDAGARSSPPSPTEPVATSRPPATAAREAPARETSKEAGLKETPLVAQGPRFAVEFGPFLTGTEAERTERQLNQAGHLTVRFRQQTGAAVYAVLLERVPGTREAEALVTTLREQGFPDATALGAGETITIRVGEPMLLRAAVELAESLRAKGHQVRVAAQPGEAQTFVIRHGNFVSREEAEARAAELGRLGLPNHVVRAK